jgi:hypothetical protein
MTITIGDLVTIDSLNSSFHGSTGTVKATDLHGFDVEIGDFGTLYFSKGEVLFLGSAGQEVSDAALQELRDALCGVSHSCDLVAVKTDGTTQRIYNVHDESAKMEKGVLVFESANPGSMRIYYVPDVAYWYTEVC